MRMNRRNVLAGIGALTAGGGAIFGSGAFSQVEADRTVDVDVAGDANAYLQLDGNTDLTAISQSDGLVSIDLSSDTFSGSGGGVNLDATTYIGVVNETDGSITSVDTPALSIANRGSDDVTVTASVTTGQDLGDAGDIGDVLELWVDDPNTDSNSVTDITNSGLTLSTGDDPTNAVVVINTTGLAISDVNEDNPLIEEITITATTA